MPGRWHLQDAKARFSELVRLAHSNGPLHVTLPGLMKMVVAPVVEAEFEKMVEQYIANLAKRFGGEA